MKDYLSSKIVLIASAIWLFTACSTDKDVPLNRGYHNMTARFNGYYNAGVVIDLSLGGYRDTYVDEYHKLLPLEIYPTEKDASNLFPDMDRAIEKCERVILRHSMPRKKKKDEEWCRWIDDNWLVIAKAHYFKREYPLAEQKFNYVQKTYNGQESVHEAQIWLAKTYIATKNFSEAKRVLSLVETSVEKAKEEWEKNIFQKMGEMPKKRQEKKKNKKKNIVVPALFPKRLLVDYEATVADLHIQQREYKQAIEHLEEAIKVCKDSKRRARYMYVLAQLYQLMGDGQMSVYYYTKVARSNAPYVMRFQAKINRALSATSGSAQIRKDLYKMLKDEKNAEYRDQIYYVLGEMDYKEGNDSGAIKNYSASVYWSVKNPRQKGISYLRLADMHFAETDYVKSQKYYDSCVKVMPEDYENYKEIKAKADGLSGLVFHYETVVFEDSVQVIAAMDPEAREKYLEKTLKDIKEREEERKRQEQERLLLTQTKVNDQSSNSGSGSKWYFYNSKVRASGFNDFRVLWGTRPLEDNWRRSDKSSFATETEEGDTSVVTEAKSDTLTVEMLMEDIPLTPEELEASNDRLMNSLYMLGIIYKEQLKEESEAINYFNQVVNRGIEHPQVLPAMYQLYLIYQKKGSPESEKYKQLILSKYPDSDIAKLLNDPEYLRKKEEESKEELNEYSKTLYDYKQQLYGAVITKCNEVITYDTANAFLNKYYLLKAFAISKTSPGNTEAISSPLLELYKKDPDSDEGKQAKIYLDKLGAGQSITDPDQNNNQTTNGLYKVDTTSAHFFVLAIPSSETNVNALKIKMSNFNNEFYRNSRYQVINSQLGTTHQLIIVKQFAGASDANKYHKTFKSDAAKRTIGNMASEYESFYITSANFSTLMQSLVLETYLDFFKANYKE